MLKSELESEIENIVTIFFNEQMGLSPTFLGVRFWDDMCIAKVKNTLTPAEINFIGDFMFLRQIKIGLIAESTDFKSLFI